jgi:hypothetical protein
MSGHQGETAQTRRAARLGYGGLRVEETTSRLNDIGYAESRDAAMFQ